MTLSITVLSAECHYAVSRFIIVMLSVIILSVALSNCYVECRGAISKADFSPKPISETTKNSSYIIKFITMLR